MIIKVGMDTEFMAVKKGKYAYPILDKDLNGVGCDEFGHCVEIRPDAATKKEDLMFNIMREMSRLPEKMRYMARNAAVIPEGDFTELLKAQGSKEVPGCSNIYGLDILKSTAFEKKWMAKGQKVVYCGMHIHVSTALDIDRRLECKKCGKERSYKIEVDVPLPYRILTRLFDEYLFTPLQNDPQFSVGRYRSAGFYELKTQSHFEYRSLGTSAFTPKRVGLVFDIVKYIMENYDLMRGLMEGYSPERDPFLL